MMIQLKSYPDIVFPTGFLWGASTAGAQIEGNNCSWHDDPRYAPKFAYGGVPYQMAGEACRSYEMYEADIALLKQMHLNSYRLSIEWCRIEPEKGKWDDQAIEHYLTVLKRLKEEHIKTVVTLHHVSHPVWFHEAGAFKTMDNLQDFLDYVDHVIPIYKDVVDYWLVINEMNLPFEYSIDERINMLQYHAKAYHVIKKYTQVPVSSTLSFSFKEPFRGKYDMPDRVLADYVDFVENEFFIHAIRTGEIIMPFHDAIMMPELKDTCDFWAINTYIRQLINSRSAGVRFDTYTATHFQDLKTPFYTEEICPDIMLQMCMRFKDKPIMVTENGIACQDEQLRITYIASMLQALKQGMDLGAEVLGYLHWSLLDNWEWGTYHPTFGLASVNHQDFSRTLKLGGKFYGEIAQNNALTQKIIQKYINEK